MAEHPLITLLATAHIVGKLSKPVVKLAKDHHVWRFAYVTKATRSENNGGCYISMDGLYLGWLGKTGTTRWSWDVANQTKTAAETMIQMLNRPDLKEHLAAVGRECGCCCFCGLELTNEGSLHYGYGPICADRWGLPWSSSWNGDAQTLPEPEDF